MSKKNNWRKVLSWQMSSEDSIQTEEDYYLILTRKAKEIGITDEGRHQSLYDAVVTYIHDYIYFYEDPIDFSDFFEIAKGGFAQMLASDLAHIKEAYDDEELFDE